MIEKQLQRLNEQSERVVSALDKVIEVAKAERDLAQVHLDLLLESRHKLAQAVENLNDD